MRFGIISLHHPQNSDMELPGALLNDLKDIPGFNRDAFRSVHQQEQAPVSLRINPLKPVTAFPRFSLCGQVPWCSTGFYLPERPLFAQDPLWHAGAYYVQEASSMFLEQVWRQYLASGTSNRKILDLCAAPGGKSTHLLSLMEAGDLLVSNEVISGRVSVLLENITRWGSAQSIVTQNDPRDFSALEGVFDLVVADVPCSGSGLFRRDPSAVRHWSPDAVEACNSRQRRILTDIWPAIAPGGILVYTTCSFSPLENEAITSWLGAQTNAQPLTVSFPEAWGIVSSVAGKDQLPGYRFFPHLLSGEGFFLAAFRKPDGIVRKPSPAKRPTGRQDIPVQVLQEKWIKANLDLAYYRHEQTLYAMPDAVYRFFIDFRSQLHVRKAGVCLGTWNHEELQPDHALAMSALMKEAIPDMDMSLDLALTFLRKENVTAENSAKGWLLARYGGIALGWMKHIGSRTNNYYPKDLRLRQVSES